MQPHKLIRETRTQSSEITSVILNYDGLTCYQIYVHHFSIIDHYFYLLPCCFFLSGLYLVLHNPYTISVSLIITSTFCLAVFFFSGLYLVLHNPYLDFMSTSKMPLTVKFYSGSFSE